jgi:hypothetical protein
MFDPFSGIRCHVTYSNLMFLFADFSRCLRDVNMFSSRKTALYCNLSWLRASLVPHPSTLRHLSAEIASCLSNTGHSDSRSCPLLPYEQFPQFPPLCLTRLCQRLKHQSTQLIHHALLRCICHLRSLLYRISFNSHCSSGDLPWYS